MKTIRSLLHGTRVPAVLALIALSSIATAQDDPYAEPEEPGLPPSNMVLDLPRTSIGSINGVLNLSPVQFAANAALADTEKLGRAAQIQTISPCSLRTARLFAGPRLA